MLSKFLDPKNDVAFKKIFGTEKNQEILIHFLNDMVLFPGGRPIQKVSFLKTTQDPETAAQKTSLVDILCTDESGVRYIVEMQVAKDRGFEKRAQYYASKVYTSQMQVGQPFHELKEVIFLAIVDFVMFPHKKAYKSDHVILYPNNLKNWDLDSVKAPGLIDRKRPHISNIGSLTIDQSRELSRCPNPNSSGCLGIDQASHEHDLRDFSFTFLELPKFTKEIDELSNITEKWAYFFKHASETSEEELQQLIGEDLILEKAYQELNRFRWDERELLTYEQADMQEKVYYGALEQKFDEGKTQGLEEGRVRGLEEGKAQGREEERAKVIEGMLAQNIPDSTICAITGLSIDTLQQIKSRFLSKR